MSFLRGPATRASLFLAILLCRWELAGATSNATCAGASCVEIDACRPLGSYSKAEALQWLNRNFGSKVKASYDGEMDGLALTVFAESQDVLSASSPLLSIVSLAHLPSLVSAIHLAKTHPYLSLPPRMDPCRFTHASKTRARVRACMRWPTSQAQTYARARACARILSVSCSILHKAQRWK